MDTSLLRRIANNTEPEAGVLIRRLRQHEQHHDPVLRATPAAGGQILRNGPGEPGADPEIFKGGVTYTILFFWVGGNVYKANFCYATASSK